MLYDMYYHSGELKNLDSGYIFRGEGSDEYHLLPSVLRKSNQNKLLRIAWGSSKGLGFKKIWNISINGWIWIIKKILPNI